MSNHDKLRVVGTITSIRHCVLMIYNVELVKMWRTKVPLFITVFLALYSWRNKRITIWMLVHKPIIFTVCHSPSQLSITVLIVRHISHLTEKHRLSSHFLFLDFCPSHFTLLILSVYNRWEVQLKLHDVSSVTFPAILHCNTCNTRVMHCERISFSFRLFSYTGQADSMV